MGSLPGHSGRNQNATVPWRTSKIPALGKRQSDPMWAQRPRSPGRNSKPAASPRGDIAPELMAASTLPSNGR